MPSPLSPLRFIGRNRSLRRCLAAYALFALVEFSIWLALLLYAYDRGGAGLAGLVAIAQLIPALVLVPACSSLGDRLPRGRALTLTHALVAISTGATALLLLADAPLALVVTGGAAATTCVALVRPVHFAALPQIAGTPEEVVSGNAASSVLDGIAMLAGPVIAGIVVSAVGSWAVFAGAAIASLIASALCAGLRLPPGGGPLPGANPTALREAVAGLVSLWGNWATLTLLLVMGTRFVMEGALDVMGVSWSISVLGDGGAAAGLVIGSVGIGGLVGAATAASMSARDSLAHVVAGGGLLLGIGVASVALIGSLGMAMTVLALAGFGATILMVAGRTLIQRSTDDRVMARVFAVQESTSLLGLAIGAGLAPLLITSFGPDTAFIPLGLGVALLMSASYLVVRRLDRVSSFRRAEVARLRSAPTLELLPEYQIEQIARHARWLDVVAGEVVVRAGDPGDEFFVVDRGLLEKSLPQGGTPRPIGPGDAFGTSTALGGHPRQSTVVACTDARLLVVPSSVFVAAARAAG